MDPELSGDEAPKLPEVLNGFDVNRRGKKGVDPSRSFSRNNFNESHESTNSESLVAKEAWPAPRRLVGASL